jgi:hypothetical protein
MSSAIGLEGGGNVQLAGPVCCAKLWANTPDGGTPWTRR